MKKRMVALFMVTIMTVGMFGCGSGQAAENDASSVKTEEAGTAEAQTEKNEDSAEGMDICMALNGSINDNGWNYSCYKGLMEIEESLGANVVYTENVQDSDMVSVFTEYANTTPDLIIGTGQQFYEAIAEVAEQYPDIEFVCLNGDAGNGSNLTAYNFTNWEPGYVAGALAGLLTETNKVAAIGGFEFTAIATSQEAFAAGAKAVNPDCEVQLPYVNTFTDAGSCKEATLSLISQGYDVFMANASSAGLGTIEACEESGVYDVGFIDDQYEVAPEVVVLSALQSNNKMIARICEDASAGKLDHDITVLGTADGVEGISDWHGWDETLDPEIVETINGIVEKLIAGEIENPLE